MTEQPAPRLSKLPFLLGDILLVGVAVWVALLTDSPPGHWQHLIVAVSVGVGAWLAVLPFILEYRASLRRMEVGQLASAVEQIQSLQAVGDQVAAATARWQTVQECADRTARTAREIADQIGADARSFGEAMQKNHDAEIRNLRLEVEKLHRLEGEWLQVVVRMLDHVYALYSAAVRSAQPELTQQLGHFQEACRDAAKRVGLSPVEARIGVAFDDRIHQVPEGVETPKAGRVAQSIATGYSYQGQLLRRALVLVEAQPAAGPPADTDQNPQELPLS